jgi:hypothetical protein
MCDASIPAWERELAGLHATLPPRSGEPLQRLMRARLGRWWLHSPVDRRKKAPPMMALEPRTLELVRRHRRYLTRRSHSGLNLELSPKYWRATRGRLRADELAMPISAFEVPPRLGDAAAMSTNATL